MGGNWPAQSGQSAEQPDRMSESLPASIQPSGLALQARTNDGYKVPGYMNFDSTYSDTFLGIGSGATNTGSNNTGTGYGTLYTNNTGSNNTANGMDALYRNTIGGYNTANGMDALYSNTTGSFNTANGFNALYYNNGSYNTANGHQSLVSNTTGTDNSAFGTNALGSNSSGNNNTAVGFSALAYNTTGTGNTAVGISAGNNYGGVMNTANTWCTFIGDYTSSSVDGVTNSTAIGSYAVVTKSNQMVLGNNQVKETLLHGATSVDGIAVCLANGTGCPNPAPIAQPVWVSGPMVDGGEIACPSGTHGSTWKFSNSGGVLTMSVLCN